MTRQLLLSLLCGCALALPSFSRAHADDLPLRKAGLWELKIAKSGSQLPDLSASYAGAWLSTQ